VPNGKFLTNHALVLLCVAEDPDSRIRDIADAVGITERAAHRIVSDLIDEGCISRERRGRRNHYKVNRSVRIRHRLTRDYSIGQLLSLLVR
jgi:predicted transcriptional regulator